MGWHDVGPGAGGEGRAHGVHHSGLLFGNHLDGVALLVKAIDGHLDYAVGGYGGALPVGDLHLCRCAVFSGLRSSCGRGAGRHKQTQNKQ